MAVLAMGMGCVAGKGMVAGHGVTGEDWLKCRSVRGATCLVLSLLLPPLPQHFSFLLPQSPVSSVGSVGVRYPGCLSTTHVGPLVSASPKPHLLHSSRKPTPTWL